MIYILIGQSASGKTTYVLNKFTGEMKLNTEPIKHTIVKNDCLIGDYKTDKDCKGTDTLPFDSLNKIIKFIRNNHTNFDNIVAEGDRINNKKFIKYMYNIDEDCKVILFKTSMNKSIERRKQRNSNPNKKFIKATRTKSFNNYIFSKKLGINTEVIET